MRQIVKQELREPLVNLDGHQRFAAAPPARGEKRADVPTVISNQSRNSGEHAGLIRVQHQQSVVGARKVCLQPVNLKGADESGSEARPKQSDLLAGAFHLDQHRVRMHITQVRFRKLVLQSNAERFIQSVRNPLIIRKHAEDSANERQVGAVTLRGFRERTMQRETHAPGWFDQQIASQQSQAARSSRMRTGRPDHDGTDDIE